MYFFHIKLSNNSMMIKPKTVETNASNVDERLDFFYNTLDINAIDILPLNEEMDLIVDDEGLLKSDNPVFAIYSSTNKVPLFVAGEFLIGKKVLTEEGYEIVGFDTEEELKSALHNVEFSVFLVRFTR